MTKFLAFIAFVVFAHVGAQAQSNDRKQFCAGYEEGFRSIKGKHAYLPTCPYAPSTPYGSTPFREGIKAGIARAQR